MKKIRYDLVLVSVFVFILVFLISQDLKRLGEVKDELSRVSILLTYETGRKKGLESSLSEVRSGKSVESIARTRLGLVKQNETAYKIISGKDETR